MYINEMKARRKKKTRKARRKSKARKAREKGRHVRSKGTKVCRHVMHVGT